MEEIIASLTPMQKAWFAQSLIELAEDSRVSASNHHLWALGSDTQGQAISHEETADECRDYADKLIQLKNLIEG